RLQYNHTRIIINRPCLCRMDGQIPHESARSKQFNRNAAIVCLESARDTIHMLPDVPNPAGLYATTPWWCLPHFLVSAGSIVIVEAAMKAAHGPAQADGMFADAKRVIDWLRIMGATNVGAAQAARTLSKLLQAAAPKIGQVYSADGPPQTSSPMTGLEGNYVTSGSSKAGSGVSSSQPQFGYADKTECGQELRALQGKSEGIDKGSPTTNSRVSLVDNLDFLATYDQMPPSWSERNSVDSAEITSTSMMFPSPQQM